ncbi:PIR Superfamily Protein [Plasmodium ovale curtisi]|uniref:PIR Superfamily Protein n=1 Tax=Plasmodium ovale curtisi TaxID=864141 RepID=A0A1A8WH61_PLAOA|nr:PIR Superfamily Protein [Plasmodium ovale curtisi]
MSTKYEDNFIQDLEQRYNFITGFPLYSLYKSYITNYAQGDRSYNYCDHYMEGDQPHITNIRNICKNFRITLSYFSTFMNNLNSEDVRRCCEYLYFWLHDHIKNINHHIHNNENLYNAIDFFKNEYSLNMCPDPRQIKVNSKKFDDMKKLYFHTQILYWIEHKVSIIHAYDESMYKNYLDECSKFYNEITDEDYCKLYTEYKSDLENFEKQIQKTRDILLRTLTIISLNSLNKRENNICTAELLDPKEEAQELNSVHTSLASRPLDGYSNVDINSETLQHNHKNTSVGVISGVITGISLLLLFAYKFTPFGIWLSSRIRGDKKITNNEENENHPLLDNSQNSYYSIRYHSSQNI